MLVDPLDLVKFYGEDLEDVKKLLEMTKQNEELKISQKLSKRNLKRLKKEYFDLKQSNLHCKHLESYKLKSHNATTFSEVLREVFIKRRKMTKKYFRPRLYY